MRTLEASVEIALSVEEVCRGPSRAHLPGGSMRYAVPGGTKVSQTVVGDEERTGGFFKLAFPLVEAVVHRQMAADLATLKDVLENRA